MALFVTFEGIDGSGKSTQAKLLHSRLRRNGVPVRLVREPGATALGERLRRILSSPRCAASLPIDPLAEVFLFAAARAQLVKEVVLPSLWQGTTVVSDRYLHSTTAYQGYGRGTNLNALEAINRISTGDLRPDLVVLLDLEPAGALARRGADEGARRFEEEELAFHQRIREGYLEMARKEPGRWLVVDGNRPKDALAAEIWERVKGLLDRQRA
ncbi:MAG: dTMP kinase [Chloroflexi bacterium]|nr:dTMP kinase [Chloroflexota bacterium]